MPHGRHCSWPKYAERRRLRHEDWRAERSLTGDTYVYMASSLSLNMLLRWPYTFSDR